MTAKIIDGKAVAAKIRQDCRARVTTLRDSGVTPGLAVILVGGNAASAVYVASKIKACAEVGVRSFRLDFPDTAATEQSHQTDRPSARR